MTRDLVILGCGGFGREVVDVVLDIDASATDTPWKVVGFLDDSPAQADLDRVQRLGQRVLGTVDATVDSLSGTHYVVAVGDPGLRKGLVERAERAGLVPATLVHPGARLGSDVTLGDGTIVCGGVSVTTNIRIGRHVQLHPNAAVGHDSTIGDYVTVTPLVAISGNCAIDEMTFLGTHSVIMPGLRVGSDATVGAGACVVRDVPPGATVKGVPAQ